MKVVGGLVNNNCVASIVTPRGAAAESGSLREDIDELAFAFVAPLGAEYKRGRHTRGGYRAEEREFG